MARASKQPGDPGAIEREVRALADEEHRAGMARFGITGADLLGVSVTSLRRIARQYEPDHALAGELWGTGVHEIRILASMLDRPGDVTETQMDRWVGDFDSWDLCDQTCLNLFDRTDHAIGKAYEWARREPEFERRAGYVLMAAAAVHRADLDDGVFLAFLPELVTGMTDGRNFVKKAVSWSFRQIGKRDDVLAGEVLAIVEPFLDSTDRTERWIARDVARDLVRPAASASAAGPGRPAGRGRPRRWTGGR